MSDRDHPVFVVGVGTDVLSLVRIFREKNVVCWACSSRRVPGTVSSGARYWRIPDPREDEEGMVESLVELARKQDRPPVIFTGCDQHAQALARYRDRLLKVAIPCIARSEVVELLVHKRDFSAWAKEHVASYPLSVSATEFQSGHSIPFPVIGKPNHRGFAGAVKLDLPSEEELHDRRFTLLRDTGEWESYKKEQRRFLPHLLIQEYIQGTSASKYSVCIYADESFKIKALFVGRRLRGFPAQYGDASLVQSDEVPDSVLSEVTEIVRQLRYQGIAEIEFNQDEVTGQFRLLEVNPRCWGWIGLTDGTDCNVPWIAYQELTGHHVAGVRYGPKPGSVKMVFLALDIANVFLRYRRDYPAWVMSPRVWWRSLRADKLSIWEFDRRDWRGTLWCIVVLAVKGITYAIRPLKRSIS